MLPPRPTHPPLCRYSSFTLLIPALNIRWGKKSPHSDSPQARRDASKRKNISTTPGQWARWPCCCCRPLHCPPDLTCSLCICSSLTTRLTAGFTGEWRHFVDLERSSRYLPPPPRTLQYWPPRPTTTNIMSTNIVNKIFLQTNNFVTLFGLIFAIVKIWFTDK